MPAIPHPLVGQPNSPLSTQPAVTFIDVTPSDGEELTYFARAFRVGTTAGDVEVVTFAGDTVVIPNVQIGETIVGTIKQIKAENTTAEGITVSI